MKRLAFFLPLTLLAACAPGQMRLPASMAASEEQITFENMSGWDKGRFTAGAYGGTYERKLDRLGIFALRQTDGRASFTIGGPGISTTIEGHCGVREHALSFDDFEFKPGRMAYRCEFEADGNPLPARFEVQESRRGLAANLTRNARRGEIGLAGEIVQFRSVHEIEGSSLPVENPIGYVFEQDGQPIGALQLNGKPVLKLPAGTDLDRRRTMMVAAVALATFWDPAAT